MRIWHHAYQSKATKILIYSPDTDVYSIGLPLHQDCIIQINVFACMLSLLILSVCFGLNGGTLCESKIK